MSASVIRRGLELFNEKDGVKRKQKKSSSCRKSALMEQISTDKQGVHKRIRQLQRPRGSSRSKNTVKDKHIRSALDEYRKKQKKNQLQSNLKYFLGAGYKTSSKDTGKIIRQHSGRRACHQPDPSASEPKEQSVFTAKDFKKFQKEYFSNLKGL
ncbi:active regulator of SIRT1 [Garra rufa]|uniref:active regulator of SIRT1 n=1 Tax=Garra rufa TaxID=137080 RepID=UPI003CCEC21B